MSLGFYHRSSTVPNLKGTVPSRVGDIHKISTQEVTMKTKVFLLVCLLILVISGLSKAEVHFLVEPRLGLSTEYDDNIYFSSSEEISDLLFYLSPEIIGQLKSDTGSYFLDYEYQRVTYTHQSSRNSDRHYLTSEFSQKLGENWSFYLKDNFMRSEDPIQIQEFIGNIKYEKLKYDYNEGEAYFNYSINEDSFFRLSYHNMIFKNRSSIVENTASHNPYLDLVYWFSIPWGIHLQLGENFGLFDYSPDFTETHGAVTLLHRIYLDTVCSLKFSFSSMNFEEQNPDYEIYDFSLGLNKNFSETTTLALGTGYYYQNVRKLDNEDGISAYLTFIVDKEKYYLSVECSKGYDEIYFDGEDLGFSHYSVIGSIFNYYLSDKVSLSTRISYRKDKFPHVSPEIKENTFIFDYSLNWKINKWLLSSLSYMHWNRSANEEAYEYRDNRITLNFTISKNFIW